jgi:hypothetical protein
MSPMNVALVLVWVVAIALAVAVRPPDCASVTGTWAEMVMSDCPKMTARSASGDHIPTPMEEYRGFMLTVVPQPNDRFHVDVVPVGGGKVWSTDTLGTAEAALARAKLKIDGKVFAKTR